MVGTKLLKFSEIIWTQKKQMLTHKLFLVEKFNFCQNICFFSFEIISLNFRNFVPAVTHAIKLFFSAPNAPTK
jgi:hypothetical protein